jgi:hypothetical protein
MQLQLALAVLLPLQGNSCFSSTCAQACLSACTTAAKSSLHSPYYSSAVVDRSSTSSAVVLISHASSLALINEHNLCVHGLGWVGGWVMQS